MSTSNPARISTIVGNNVAHSIWKSAQGPASDNTHRFYSIALYMDLHDSVLVIVDSCIYNSVYTSVFNFLHAYDGFS